MAAAQKTWKVRGSRAQTQTKWEAPGPDGGVRNFTLFLSPLQNSFFSSLFGGLLCRKHLHPKTVSSKNVSSRKPFHPDTVSFGLVHFRGPPIPGPFFPGPGPFSRQSSLSPDPSPGPPSAGRCPHRFALVFARVVVLAGARPGPWSWPLRSLALAPRRPSPWPWRPGLTREKPERAIWVVVATTCGHNSTRRPLDRVKR